MKLRTKILGINVLALVLVLAAMVYFTAPIVLHSQGEDSLYLFIALMIGVGGASILISTLLLEAMVIRRIYDLTGRVNHIKDYRSYYEALHYNGSDEVAVLAKAINQMLQRIVSSTNEVGQLNAKLQEEKATVEKQVLQRTEQLDAEKARLKASVTNLSLGFIMTDIQNNILLINDQAQAILRSGTPETTKAAVPAHQWTIAEIDKQMGADLGLLDKIALSLRGGETSDFNDVEYGEHILRILISPILATHHDGPLGCVIVLEDVTDEKLLERSRDEFFSIASHELRTPLTAIRGNTALIRQFYEERLNDATFNEMVDDIHGASVRLIRIVNDFLDISRLEQGKITFHPEPFDVTEVLEGVVYETVGMTREHGDKIVIDHTLKTAPLVYADKDRVKQVIYNLIGNALKFTENGTITITLEKEGSMLKLSVTDTGPGISPENQRVLFRKFRQVGPDSLTRETSHGTGLGLYISKLLVSHMGGTIGLEHSEIGKGSTFAFTLPIYKG